MAFAAFAKAAGKFAGKYAVPVISGLFGLKGARQQNVAASAQAERQMKFQERMSSTAHQREVKDLRAAGLNPILSATGGSGASSPGGAQAPVQDVIKPAISSAFAARRFDADMKQMSQQLKNLAKVEWLTDAQTMNTLQSSAESVQREDNLRRQGRLLDFTMPGAAIESNIDSSRYGEFFRMMGRWFGGGGSSAKFSVK